MADEKKKDRLPSIPWCFGHWHEDKDWDRYHTVFERVLQIV